jgi:hypothetical protein
MLILSESGYFGLRGVECCQISVAVTLVTQGYTGVPDYRGGVIQHCDLRYLLCLQTCAYLYSLLT